MVADTHRMPLNVEKIRQLREAAGLSMDQAAKLAGMNSRQRWYEVESGLRANITIGTLDAMARALGVEPADLLAKAKRK
jgi:transcriptional regulator with XRE-family HTH domain